MEYAPHPYQYRAIEMMAQNPGSAMLLDPGMGKTSIALAFLRVLKHHGEMSAALIIAPIRPMRLTWPAEVQKWDQFRALRVSIVHGSPTQRIAAMKRGADIYLINPENVDWLAKYSPNLGEFGNVPDVLIVDESTRFKNSRSARFKALKGLLPKFARRHILTGTPAPQSVEDMFAQMQIVDDGARLGRYITHFRKLFMLPEEIRIGGGRTITQWHPKPDAAEAVASRIKDCALRLQAEDYLQMPDLIHNTVPVELPAQAMNVYHSLERTLVAETAGVTLTAATAAAAVMKLRQVTNGWAYAPDGTSSHLHDAKLDALVDLVEEQQGQPILVAVAFLHEVDAIRKALGDPTIPYLGGGVSHRQADEIVERWNLGKVPVLLAHPTSVAHGLNLQAGGHAVAWFGLTWNLEEHEQFNARVYRQGQDKPVVIHYLIARGTVDEDLALALINKADVQRSILNRLKKDPTE